jgi:hypothetical protein
MHLERPGSRIDILTYLTRDCIPHLTVVFAAFKFLSNDIGTLALMQVRIHKSERATSNRDFYLKKYAQVTANYSAIDNVRTSKNVKSNRDFLDFQK